LFMQRYASIHPLFPLSLLLRVDMALLMT
jgi:hypothetical protein